MVNVIFGELHFVHESFFQCYDAFPTKYLMLQILSHSLSGVSLRTSKAPVVPINVNSNAFLVSYIVFKKADWLETHLWNILVLTKKLFSTFDCQNGLDLPTSDSNCPATTLRNIAEIKTRLIIYSEIRGMSYIIMHRNMTLNIQKQCSLSYLLNAAVRSRLWRVPTFPMTFTCPATMFMLVQSTVQQATAEC
jgi:hypothetical protein